MVALVSLIGAFIVWKTWKSSASEQVATAYQLYGGKKYVEAEAAFREAIRLAPNEVFLPDTLAGLLGQQNRYPEVESFRREALQITMNDVRKKDYVQIQTLLLRAEPRRTKEISGS